MEIFHGGCHGCVNQAIKGIGYCDGCTYRRSGRRDLPNLYRSQDDLLELKKLYEQIFGDNSNRLEPLVILGLRHKYSGEDSRLFWKYVAASGERKDEFYSLGVALQNLEEFVLKLMKDACPNFVESKQASE